MYNILMDIEPVTINEQELSKERTRELKESDSQKILTQRSVERTYRDGGGDFESFFGLDNVMKAFVRLNTDKIEDGVFWRRDKGNFYWSGKEDDEINYVGMNELCLEEAKLRKEVGEEEALKKMLEKYSPDIMKTDDEIAVEVKREPSDRILVVGDPDHMINRQLDRPGVDTIDYEDGFDARAAGSKTVNGVISEIDNHLEGDTRAHSYSTANYELDEFCNQEPGENPETDWYCDPRQLPEGYYPLEREYVQIEVEDIVPSGRSLMGTTDSPGSIYSEDDRDTVAKTIKTVEGDYSYPFEKVEAFANEVGNDPEKIRGVGIVFLVGTARRLSENLAADSSPENMALAKKSWEAVKIKLDQNPRKGIKYDTTEGLHPFETFASSLNQTTRNAVTELEVLYEYQTKIFPETIRKHLEELAEIHISVTTDPNKFEDPKTMNYIHEWKDFLETKGIKSKDLDIEHPEIFIDTLIQFLLIKGINSLDKVAPGFFEEVKSEEKRKIRERLPQTVLEKEAKFIEMMFPETQALPAHSYDRVVMSWSWSAHMLKDMTSEELVNKVWPELDRLLATGGIANIFPIGHHGVDYKWVEKTIKDYLQKTGARWEVDIDHPCWKPTENEDAEYRLLRIKRLG